MRSILFLLLILFVSCTTTNKTSNVSLEYLESTTGICLEDAEKQLIYKKNPETLMRLNSASLLSIDDIILLSQLGVSDSFLLDYLAETKGRYNLNHPEIKKMQNGSVSQKVIIALIHSGQ